MKTLLLTVTLLAPLAQADRDMARELDEVARVATAMVDGDLCQRIVTPRALEYMFKSDPRDEWVAGDNYEVDDEAFNAVKKTLIRLSGKSEDEVSIRFTGLRDGEKLHEELFFASEEVCATSLGVTARRCGLVFGLMAGIRRKGLDM